MRYHLKTQWRNVIVVPCVGAALIAAGCGSTDEGQEQQQQRPEVAAQRAARTAERQRLRQARRVEARQLREAARRKARRIAARERAREEAQREAALAREEAESEEAATSECDPSYSGACLDPYASDYDCEGGSGDGPSYTGAVAVVGDDHYELDADSDGYGCE
jgi:hypothetical protein